jgi:hypothetical protein
MTFEEILDQAMAMLQRRGRLTYSTLKRQFQLDDAALEDLKDELIYGQRLAVDEDERVLVWRGETLSAPPPLPRRPQPLSASRYVCPWPPPPRTSPRRFSSPAAPSKANVSRSRCCLPT